LIPWGLVELINQRFEFGRYARIHGDLMEVDAEVAGGLARIGEVRDQLVPVVARGSIVDGEAVHRARRMLAGQRHDRARIKPA
jgi:hypothetical protein